MTPIRIFATAAALVMAAGAIGSVDAQDQAPQQQGAPARPMMGGWWPHGMTDDGFMGPGMMGWGGMGAWMMQGGRAGQAMCGAMGGHTEGRLAYLKAELKITEAQESLWTSYAAAARDNANAMLAHCTTMMSRGGASALSLPDRLDQHEQFMAAQLEAIRTVNKALKPLYAAFSDTQKQTADQLFWGPMGMM